MEKCGSFINRRKEHGNERSQQETRTDGGQPAGRVLGLVLTSAGVGPKPLVAYGQDAESVEPEAAPYSYAFTYQGQLRMLPVGR